VCRFRVYFTQGRESRILRTSPIGVSRKSALNEFYEVGIAPVLAKLGKDRGCAEFHADVPSMAWTFLPTLLRS
jgi:hypothetical protein